MAPPEKPLKRTFQEDFEHIKFVGFWVCLFISIPSLGIPAIVAAILDPGGVDSERIETFWNVFTKTVPLTISVAILGTAYIRGWTRGFNFYGHCFFLICVLLGVAFIFNALGFDSVPNDLFDGGCGKPFRTPFNSPCKSWLIENEALCRSLRAFRETCNPNHPKYCAWYRHIRCNQLYGPILAVRIPASTLLSYWNFYGLWNFICSTVVGGFLSWAWAKKLMPHLIR